MGEKTIEETSCLPINEEYVLSKAFLIMVETSDDILFIKDKKLRYVAVSHAFANMYNLENPKLLIGKTDFDLLEDKDLANRYSEDDKKILESQKDIVDSLEPLKEDKYGNAKYGSTSKYVIKDEQNNSLAIFGIIKDVTKEFAFRQHFQHELKLLFNLPENAYASVFLDIDDWQIVGQLRQPIHKTMMHEVHTVSSLLDNAIQSIVDVNSPAAQFYKNFTAENLLNIYASGSNNLHFEYLRRMLDGSEHWVHNNIQFVVDTETGHRCVMLSAYDIDEKKKKEQSLIDSALYDKMTMVLNRDSTMKRIENVIVSQYDKTHALFMLDIDNFKQLNDTKGHQVGDEFLIAFAKVIKKCFRDSDIVGRIGGDEFFVLMKNLSDVSIAEQKAQKILDAVKKITVEYEPLPLSVSVGVSMFPCCAKNFKDLYSSADKALYKAKKIGKAVYIFAEPLK